MAPNPSPPHSLLVEPADGKEAVLSAIGSAKATLDLGIYEATDPEILGALVAARARGVTVRVLYNWYSFDPTTQQATISPAVNQLSQGGVLCRRAPPSFEVTHEKVCVVDGASALVLTFNLAKEYFQSTRDFGIVTTLPLELEEISTVFEADWNSQPATPSVPSLVWSPTNSRARLADLIGGAKATLEVYNEELSDPGILGALAAAAKNGIRVRVIAAVLSSNGQANGNAAGITYLRSQGVQAECKAFPVTTPRGPVPIYIHAKVVVVDFGASNSQAFVGSENLSCVSLDDNRECGIVVGEPAILARIESTFEADWAQPSVAVPADPSPLRPCPGAPAGRTVARIASRTGG